VAGTSYVGLGALCKLITTAHPDANVNLIPGSDVSNPLRIANKEVDIACETVCFSTAAKEGIAPFKKPVGNILSLANLRTEALLNVAVRADSGITSFEQIKEKKIPLRLGPGPRGSASQVLLEWTLAEYGISFKDITAWGGKIFNNNFNDVSDMAKDGQVDMIAWLGPGEAWFLTELSANTQLRWLPVSKEAADALNKKYMLYTGSFPASMYKGMMGQETRTVGTAMSLLVREDMSEDTAYRIARILCEGRADIGTACPQWNTFKPETAFSDMPYPLHPGAAKYYREAGLMK
jgi:TRAP transporter solute receptor, TAXI family